MRTVVLQYSTYGTPSSVITPVIHDVTTTLAPSEVLLEFLGSPVNPSDFIQIQGNYPIKPALPAVGGNEGAARVVAVGGSVRGLCSGDLVIPTNAGFGTWRTHCVVDEGLVKKIPASLSDEVAPVFAVNPCTAYRMIEDFNKPAPGGWVIQNGANSAVGRAVIQLCKAQGIRTINIIRDRENPELLKSELTQLGADAVFTASQRSELTTFTKSNTPFLGFNMICGEDTVQILENLGSQGSLITYGCMSKQPLSVPFRLLLSKDLTLRSFWRSQWTSQHARSELETAMFDELAGYFNTGQLTPPPTVRRSMFECKGPLEEAFKVKQVFDVKMTLADGRFSGDH